MIMTAVAIGREYKMSNRNGKCECVMGLSYQRCAFIPTRFNIFRPIQRLSLSSDVAVGLWSISSLVVMEKSSMRMILR